jgi:hypothetical protein
MADQLTSNGKARATPGWGGPRAVAGSVAPAEHRPVPQGARELDGFLAVICAFLTELIANGEILCDTPRRDSEREDFAGRWSWDFCELGIPMDGKLSPCS